jgi:hypothetical protein
MPELRLMNHQDKIHTVPMLFRPLTPFEHRRCSDDTGRRDGSSEWFRKGVAAHRYASKRRTGRPLKNVPAIEQKAARRAKFPGSHGT